LLLGDADQLPSVGAGQVLRDIIASGATAVVQLTDAFRQAQESDIVAAAHRILQGLLPEEQRSRGQGEFLFIEEEDPVRAVRTVVELVRDRIPRRLPVDPVDGIRSSPRCTRARLARQASTRRSRRSSIPQARLWCIPIGSPARRRRHSGSGTR
ncbi:MAG: AAA family ATPase, partial [Spirochaetes bacterium]|nr:AAA family ATPase [Spirochaetota bacterium]